jgi:hypothetical protein
MVASFLLLAFAGQSLPAPAATDSTVSIAVGAPMIAPADTVKRRPRAIEYSDAYFTRLQIHRIGSYTMLPLFAAEFALGQNLLNTNGRPQESWMKGTHAAIGLGIGALFTINTVTGGWNLWDSRSDPAGRTRRWLHSALMIASDAGFVWTGQLAGDAGHSVDAQRHHRNVALGSMAISAVGAGMMWLWKN